MTALQIAAFLLVAIGGTVTLFDREPLRQTLLFSVYGMLMTLLFLTIQAPDVALSELAVGAVALPLMLLIALTSVRVCKKAKE